MDNERAVSSEEKQSGAAAHEEDSEPSSVGLLTIGLLLHQFGAQGVLAYGVLALPTAVATREELGHMAALLRKA